MSDIHEIKRRLVDRVYDVAEMLLPGGRKDGHEWRAGSVSGDAGHSLAVKLDGAKAGVWADFASGTREDRGDLLDLWMATKRIPLTAALDEARAYLGMERAKPSHEPKKIYVRPPKPRCSRPKGRVLDYLQEDRNIPRSIIDAYKVGERDDRIVFPFQSRSGELVLVKERVAQDGAKPVPTSKDAEPILFGWQAIDPNAREITITEGEIDALSMAAFGFPAMSIPFGGGDKGKQKWIENEYDNLERFERIYIATDMDEVGEAAAIEIASRLGHHRCYRVKLPRKDANQCLIDGVDKADIAVAISNAEGMGPEGLRSAGYYRDQVERMFWPHHGDHVGYTLPLGALSGRLHFRPAELTLWSGATGSGKTKLICACVPHWLTQGSRLCIASFEMEPKQTLRNIVKQSGGIDRPTSQFLTAIFDFLDDGLLIYEKVGKATIERVLEVFDYAHAKYGCDQFVLDSLMRIDIPSDDYAAQERAVFRLTEWAVERKVHLHLVAHARKAGRDNGVPETEDVKGASEIGANAFNILTLWRNRKLEEEEGTGNGAVMTEKPGVTLNVAKQRNGDFEGKCVLWFNRNTFQYFSSGDDRRMPRCYVEFDNHQGQAS